MNVEDLETPMVYVVRWPDGVVKVGHSVHAASRVKTLMRYGAALVTAAPGPKEKERAAIEVLGIRGTRAFRSRVDAFAYLGGGSSGFTECYRLDDEALERFLSWFRLAVG